MSDEQPSIPERLATLSDLVQRLERDLSKRIQEAEARLAALTKTANNVDGVVAAIQNHAQRLAALSRHRHLDDGKIFIPLDGS